jgi:hypothetical protein
LIEDQSDRSMQLFGAICQGIVGILLVDL